MYRIIFAPTLDYLERSVRPSFFPISEKPLIENRQPFETEALGNTFLAPTMCAQAPFTSVFKLKPLDIQFLEVFHKARCCIRGDRQTPYVDFDPSNIYAPVANHEAIRLYLALAAGENRIFEGAYIRSAHI